MPTGIIYGYKDSAGEICYIGQTINLSLRDRQHRGAKSQFGKLIRRLSISVEGPIVLERVEGSSQYDLRLNLSWAETIWMFRLKTYRPSFGRGFNFCLPYPSDFEGSSKAGAAVAKAIISHEQRVAWGKQGAEQMRKPGSPGYDRFLSGVKCYREKIASDPVLRKKAVSDAQKAGSISLKKFLSVPENRARYEWNRRPTKKQEARKNLGKAFRKLNEDKGHQRKAGLAAGAATKKFASNNPGFFRECTLHREHLRNGLVDFCCSRCS